MHLRSAVCIIFLLSIANSIQAADLYVSYTSRNTIDKFSSTGVRSNFATGLPGPYGLAFDTSGNLFAASYHANTITKFTSAGSSVFATGLAGPVGLAFDSASNLFVANSSSGEILSYTPSGARSTFFTGLSSPAGISFDTAGNLFVTNQGDFSAGQGTIDRITPSGMRTTIASGLYDPFGLAFDASGNLFVADEGSGKVFKFSPSFSKTTFATLSTVSEPLGIAIDGAGNIFVSEYNLGNIDKFTPSGTKSLFATGTPSNPQGSAFLAFAPVPEPTSLALVVLGVICMVACSASRATRSATCRAVSQ
jgi:streptogramin lyase